MKHCVVTPHHLTHAWMAGLIALAVWSLIWKGIALWRAGRHNQKRWFIAMLIINTAGLLEIAYLLFFSPKPTAKTTKKPAGKK